MAKSASRCPVSSMNCKRSSRKASAESQTPRWKLSFARQQRTQQVPAINPPEHNLLWKKTPGIGKSLCHCAFNACAVAASLAQTMDHGRSARSVGQLQEPLLRGRRSDSRLAAAASHLVFSWKSISSKTARIKACSATKSVNYGAVSLLRLFRAALVFLTTSFRLL